MDAELVARLSYELSAGDLRRARLEVALGARTHVLHGAVLFAMLSPLLLLGVRMFALVLIWSWAFTTLVGVGVAVLGAARSHSHGVVGPATLSLLRDGYRIEASDLVVFERWSAVREVRATRRFASFVYSDPRSHLVPARAFPDEATYLLFVRSARALWQARHGDAARELCAVGSVPTVASVRFMMTRAVVRGAVREQATSRRDLSLLRIGAALLAASTAYGLGPYACLVAFVAAYGALFVLSRFSSWVTAWFLSRILAPHHFGAIEIALSPAGIVERAQHHAAVCGLTRVRNVRLSPHFVLVSLSGGELLPIPKTAFQSEAGAQAFAHVARELVREAQAAAALTSQPA